MYYPDAFQGSELDPERHEGCVLRLYTEGHATTLIHVLDGIERDKM